MVPQPEAGELSSIKGYTRAEHYSRKIGYN